MGNKNGSETGSSVENLERFPGVAGYLVEREETLMGVIRNEAPGAYKVKSNSERLGIEFPGFAPRLAEAVIELGQVEQIMSDIGERTYLDRAREYIEKRFSIEQKLLESMRGKYPQEDIDKQEAVTNLVSKARDELR